MEVFLSGRRTEPLEKVANQAREAGGQAHVLALDIADASTVNATAKEIGHVDIPFANAGLNVPGRAMDTLSIENWDKVVNVNLNGSLYLAHAVLPGMREQSDGLIIFTASWASRYATRLTGVAYNSTKRALLALGESLNAEEGGHRIRTTVLMPGEVATDILKTRPRPPSKADMARMLQVEDIAKTVQFLAELPARVCVNEVLISPTWNRFYQDFDEL